MPPHSSGVPVPLDGNASPNRVFRTATLSALWFKWTAHDLFVALLGGE